MCVCVCVCARARVRACKASHFNLGNVSRNGREVRGSRGGMKLSEMYNGQQNNILYARWSSFFTLPIAVSFREYSINPLRLILLLFTFKIHLFSFIGNIFVSVNSKQQRNFPECLIGYFKYHDTSITVCLVQYRTL